MAKSHAACGIAMLAVWGSLGCGRTTDAPPGDQGTGQGGGQGAGGGATGLVDGGSADKACLSAVAPRSPLRRLTNFELNNTLRDLLGDASRPADSLPVDGISNNADEMVISSILADGYHTLARELAITATKDAAAVTALAGCDPLQVGEDACKQKFIVAFIPKAFRRGLDADDIADFDAVFAKGRLLGGDFASGVRAVVEVALQSPELLYRVELGDPAATATPPRPSPYEMATRLSYLLWGSTPDAALREAAAQGQLQTKEQIAAQARRLLADDRAHEVVRHFYLQFMQLDVRLSGRVFDATPSLPSNLAALLRDETTHFVDDVTWHGPGDFHSLLTAPSTWVNGALATFYGIQGITGDAFQRVNVNPAQRGGLLTQGTFLASTSHGTTTSPVQRGMWILDQIMCSLPPPPPANVDIRIPLQPPANATTRQRLETYVADPACMTCHRDIDPIGFAFEHYDAVGLWRDTENGLPIDATGAITKTDARGTFNGAIELTQRLSQSHDAQNCFVGKWMTFAYGRQETPEDACSRQVLQDAFAKANGNIPELLVALTQTDAFLYRAVKE